MNFLWFVSHISIIDDPYIYNSYIHIYELIIYLHVLMSVFSYFIIAVICFDFIKLFFLLVMGYKFLPIYLSGNVYHMYTDHYKYFWISGFYFILLKSVELWQALNIFY